METIPTPKAHFIKGAKLNLLTSILAIPLFLISVVPYAFIYGWQHTYFEILGLVDLKLFALLFLGIILHEGLHAITWVILLKKGYKSIKFGFNTHALSPYTHCSEPMKVWQYRLGGIMPGLIMGLLPVIISFFINSTLLNFVGFLFLWAAAGDMISLYFLRKLDANTMVKDHPDEMGFLVLD